MTTAEFSSAFDTVVDSYRRFKDFDDREILDSIEFSEFEKSQYLTEAQDAMVRDLYSGRNVFGEAFETTEELRRYLDPLVKEQSCSTATGHTSLSTHSSFFTLPTDLLYIIYEKAQVDNGDIGCGEAGTYTNIAVQPVTHDEYNRIKRNPFRGAAKFRVLRLDCGAGVVELVYNHGIHDYYIRYVSQPDPIILEDLTSEGLTIHGKSAVSACSLPESLHDIILRRAVQLALSAKGIRVNN